MQFNLVCMVVIPRESMSLLPSLSDMSYPPCTHPASGRWHNHIARCTCHTTRHGGCDAFRLFARLLIVPYREQSALCYSPRITSGVQPASESRHMNAKPSWIYGLHDLSLAIHLANPPSSPTSQPDPVASDTIHFPQSHSGGSRVAATFVTESTCGRCVAKPARESRSCRSQRRRQLASLAKTDMTCVELRSNPSDDE